jgi:hypothetical protein
LRRAPLPHREIVEQVPPSDANRSGRCGHQHWILIELWVPELRKLPPGQEATVWRCEPGYIGLDTYDVLQQRLMSYHFTFDESQNARLVRSPHRYIWPAELDLMAQLAGFELESRHADWSGSEFTAESGSHVSVYRIPPGH